MVNQLRDWHDFYILIATASATLIGLMFVAASVGASYFNAEREVPLRAFLTPTVVHFSVILISCLASMAPSLSGASLGAPLAVIGAVGIGFTCRAVLNLRRRGITRTIDLEDRCCYVVIPIAIYLALIATGVILPMLPDLSLDMLAVVLVALLLLGIHNAWDMTLWIVLNTENGSASVDAARPDSDRAPP
ncbi:MAG: hypothetical protein WBQ75_19390 [Acetobacteraceae bacterium]